MLHYIDHAHRHLRAADPVLRRVIDRTDGFTLKLQRNRFAMLTRSIISQQISTAAARAIRARLEALVAPQRLTPVNVARLTPDELRAAGLSKQKGAYLHALAAAVSDKSLRLDRAGRMSDEEIIEHLTVVKGIGRWTAQMFLIFSLGRPDVFPHDDLGVRSAIQHLYGLKTLPDRQTSLRVAEPWRPYATVASWYCWRSLEHRKADAKAK